MIQNPAKWAPVPVGWDNIPPFCGPRMILSTLNQLAKPEYISWYTYRASRKIGPLIPLIAVLKVFFFSRCPLFKRPSVARTLLKLLIIFFKICTFEDFEGNKIKIKKRIYVPVGGLVRSVPRPWTGKKIYLKKKILKSF